MPCRVRLETFPFHGFFGDSEKNDIPRVYLPTIWYFIIQSQTRTALGRRSHRPELCCCRVFCMKSEPRSLCSERPHSTKCESDPQNCNLLVCACASAARTLLQKNGGPFQPHSFFNAWQHNRGSSTVAMQKYEHACLMRWWPKGHFSYNIFVLQMSKDQKKTQQFRSAMYVRIT